MKLRLILILAIALLPAFSSDVVAEDRPDAAQTAETLRAQLLEIQAKESELQARARQLDEDLKPENIERSLAGIGSTKPEELREQRRRQLTIEREGVNAQLKLLARSRERLESITRTAETQAYQQSADGTTLPLGQTLQAHYAATPPWLLGMLAGLVVILGIGLVLAVKRRLV
jgi:hypothetical protein